MSGTCIVLIRILMVHWERQRSACELGIPRADKWEGIHLLKNLDKPRGATRERAIPCHLKTHWGILSCKPARDGHGLFYMRNVG
jgi:hypothetical protein